MEGKISNVAGYRFVDLPDRDELREPFRAICKKAGLKGTVLLSHEGINFFLAGSQSSIDQYLDFLEQDTRFSQMALKYSYTDYLPFNRMNVRLKKEIISLGLDHIKPAEFTGDEITPTEFKQWLDEGREVAIVDTRNDYEIRVGTFHDALDLNIKSFRAFPKAIEALPDSMKDTPVVMFCTGGIRCEKASVVMLDAGFSNVKQLKGGILGYFEEVGGEYWNGDCFVFDHRVALNSDLEESETTQCFACRQPVSIEEQQSPDYVIEVSCPHCIIQR
ncbi:MAG: sulfurtransferase [Euryarchaeota archaeon]|nr:sulfurtransferase [Euryarchaeota archaeon]MBT5595475.1 sulfurtransferase [Euryarchaeota archaeon]MBT5843364.1 sulfurtransferase [Euryarchaeota archaeon]MBT6641373.1 sulfurtransferase [Euryarchaeota archaeon]MBT6844935.1 sulfurtransferase [Euryarchaeota archaeon]